jgi:solute carrier family 8 (sodium/calcium exchanger)
MAAAEVMKWANDQCNAIVATAENQLTVDDYDCCAGGLSTPDTPKEIGYFFLSFLALCYVFLGVALGADVFMSSIETITSKEKTVKVTVDGVQKIFHTHVWNATVANLTLMALGSSAPEILLNVIDTFSGDFHASKLGPGTIVGSAAFNLFVITAVCIVAIPAGEKRTIRSMAVFVTTAVWSVWAYVWLFIILIVWTPDIITVAEAALTIGFLAILIIQAYAVDVYWDQGKAKAVKALDTARGSTRRLIRLQNGDPLDEASVKAELNARKAENQAMGKEVSDEKMAEELAKDMLPPKTRGHYRRAVMGKATGRSNGQANVDGVEMKVVKIDDIQTDMSLASIHCGLDARVVAVVEGADKVAKVTVRRQGPAEVPFTVRLKTIDATAKADKHYKSVDTLLTFDKGVMEFVKEIDLVDNHIVDHEDVTFQVQLYEQHTKDPAHKVLLGGQAQFGSCMVQIRDDDKTPGLFCWDNERIEVPESCGSVNLTVLRTMGLSGEVSIKYATKDQTAPAGKDYGGTEGTLTFAHGQVSQSITIEIIDDDTYEKDETFTVVLSEPTGGAKFDKATDGGVNTEVATVVILNDDELTSKLERVTQLLRLNADNLSLARDDWAQALKDAVIPAPGSTNMGKAMHFLNVPWKLMFAIVPPPGMCGGFPCFFGALFMIGVQVILISDFATLMGCQMSLKPEVTAITFVALGTSLPDTFASMAAARGDKYADNSIGNVTGSNSVNVFLGLGLAWLISAIYWDPTVGVGATDEWKARYPDIFERQVAAGETPGGFVVYAGNLGFSVLIFTIFAIIAISLILLRRPNELGGNRPLAFASAGLFVSLWIGYVLVSSLTTYGYITPPF